jgi:hypothetical protein
MEENSEKNEPEEENTATEENSNNKESKKIVSQVLGHPIFLILFAAVVIIGLYYLMSPFQHCIRNSPESVGYCLRRTGW